VSERHPGRSKPLIVAVDDEPQVLSAVETDLRRHFQSAYRIVKAGSGAEALATVEKLRRRGSQIALFLVDQRMPEMTGVEFLEQAMKLYPDAKKVLLTAYADTEVAISSINKIGLDYYLMKPWHPPEENLYPVLDDLLGRWEETVPPAFEGIRVAGTLWSRPSHEIKDFLARNRVPYQWLDIDRDPQARALLATIEDATSRLPVLFFPDGETLVQPERRAVAEKIGFRTQAQQKQYDLVIVGAGPAGLSAAVYGASEGLRTVLIEKDATGGQAGTSSRIENYLGFPKGLSGAELAQRATVQAQRFGAEIVAPAEAAAIRAEDPYRIVTLTDGSEIGAQALIIASGVSVRRLDVPGADKLTGAGVYYGAALTEAANYRDREVFVIGGANSAGQGALFFSRYAAKVTMLVRAASLEVSMSHYLTEQIAATENIVVWPGTEVLECLGTDRLEALIIGRAGGERQEVPAAALFVFIGAAPHTEMVANLVERDPAGFIVTGPDLVKEGRRPSGWRLARDPALLETCVPGIFAAGDVRLGSSKRVAAAMAEGAVAVQLIHQYLKTV
jgi:thioredoxin reductase (NADPH)